MATKKAAKKATKKAAKKATKSPTVPIKLEKAAASGARKQMVTKIVGGSEEESWVDKMDGWLDKIAASDQTVKLSIFKIEVGPHHN